MIGLGALHVLHYEVVPALFLRRLDDRRAPFLGTVLDPIQELVGDLRESPVGHPFGVAVCVEEVQHSFGLLEGLNESVQKKTIEASISELDAILMVLVKGVHGNLQSGEIPGAYSRGRLWIYASAETCRSKLSRPAGVGQSARVCFGSVCLHAWFSQTGDLRSVAAVAAGGSFHSGQYRRRLPAAR